MRFAVHLRPNGNVAAHSDELRPDSQRHHLFLAHWEPTDPQRRVVMYMADASFTTAVPTAGVNQPTDSTADWRKLGFEYICDFESGCLDADHGGNEASLRRFLQRLDAGRRANVPAQQRAAVFTPLWDFLDRHNGSAPLPDVSLLIHASAAKSKYDFMRW